ncbi:MAG: DNA-3-methyladenine glycosylase [Bacteroides sp.]|nr:DNA-3-methyladenine glycosylase [Bacteroides sp.]
MNKKLGYNFFHRDRLIVARELAGKIIARRNPDGSVLRVRITETEAYGGEEDKACHASKGRTPRTELLYGKAGIIYVYLCYGMHWLMNIITGEEGAPEGVLLRAGEGKFNGPAKLTKAVGVDKRFNGQSICGNKEIWIEDDGKSFELSAAPRVGIDYAGEEWKNKPWRFIITL